LLGADIKAVSAVVTVRCHAWSVTVRCQPPVNGLLTFVS
jgi:hypothetical protein